MTGNQSKCQSELLQVYPTITNIGDMPAPAQEASITSLATLSSITQALQDAIISSEQTEAALDEQLTHSARRTGDRAQILETAGKFSTAVSKETQELASLLESAVRKSDSACSNIRKLDVLLSRANEALSWADDILTLRICAEGAKTSLSADDLASAARHVETYLTLGDAIRADSASATAVSQIEQSRAELSRKVRSAAEDKLKSELSTEDAISAVQLFVPIGLANEGLTKLCEHLKTRLARESDIDVRELLLDSTAEGTGADEPHIIALARLFESVAAIAHDGRPNLSRLFGISSLSFILEGLQEQCDSSLGRILDRYEEAKRMDEVIRALRSESTNARELDGLLNELTLISQRIAGYTDFLVGKRLPTVQDTDNAQADEESAAEYRKIEKMLEKSGLFKRKRDLAGFYNAIESYFMRENARLAIKIDESNGEDAETSTAVDDFFFVVQKCFQRAFAYGDTDPEVLRLVLNQVSLCLMNDLIPYMRRRLRETEAALEKLFGNAGASSSALPAAALTVSYLTELAKANITIPGGGDMSSSNTDVAKYDFFVALNNSSVSARYASRLRSNVEKAVHASPKLSAEDRTLVVGPLTNINDASRTLSQASEQGVAKLASVLLDRVTALVQNSLKETSYMVTEAQYSLDSDATPSFSREVANQIESKVLSPSLEKRLTETNWDALVRQVAEWYAQQVEAIIFLPTISGATVSKSFTAFGALRADRDVRAISAYFSNKGRRSTVRDVFGRLSQLAMLVNLERPAEIYDVWGPNAGGMTWRLTASEVRRTLSLRSDFNKDAIKSLKL
ncbi:COG4 transport protein [Gracilaria domingensis]|nr:COG4 transport protein [Gracilaria domingensis]